MDETKIKVTLVYKEARPKLGSTIFCRILNLDNVTGVRIKKKSDYKTGVVKNEATVSLVVSIKSQMNTTFKEIARIACEDYPIFKSVKFEEVDNEET